VVPVLDHPTWAPLDLPAPGVTDQPILIESRGLFGMLTERTDVDHDEAPAVLFLNAASDRHIGPSRLWVDLAREWAARGARVLRLDLGGLGDSPTRPGYNRDVIYPPGGVGDVVAAAHFLCPEDPGRVVLVGVCSGGYYAAEAALPLKSKAIWAINPWVPLESRMTQHEPVPGAAEPKVVRRANRISARYMNNQRAIALVHKLIPKWAFWVFDKVGLYTYPLRAYGPLVAQGTDVHLLCGEQEAVQFLVRGDRLRKRMERTGRLRFSRVEVLDHGVWMPPGRAEIARLLTDYVTTDLDPTDLETTDLGIDAESPVRTG
jgi:pimeloyl-ACP methyl ester carboxylesterase